MYLIPDSKKTPPTLKAWAGNAEALGWYGAGQLPESAHNVSNPVSPGHVFLEEQETRQELGRHRAGPKPMQPRRATQTQTSVQGLGRLAQAL